MAEFKNLMISVSGVRGLVGDGLTPEVVMRFALAYASEYGPGKIVVGRDSRVTGNMVKYAVWSGLMAAGCDVIDIDIAPTPTTELLTEKQEHAGGIIITASHNPKEWNALKLLAPDGLFLDSVQADRLLARVKNSDFHFATWDRMGRILPYSNAIAEHVDAILKLAILDIPAIRRRQFTVVADCCNGAGGVILPLLLEKLGCRVIFLNQEPTGLFPRSPEPIPENLGDLCEAVRLYQADLGIAVDPDVDRLAIVSDRGLPLGEEYTLVMAAQVILRKTPGPVVINASTTRAIEDLADLYQVPVFRTPVGEIHVASRARQVGAVIAGEGNGGVIYPELHLGRDAPVGIALLLQACVNHGGTLSHLHRELPQYTMIKDKVPLSFDTNAKELVKNLEKRHSDEKLDRTDGLKVVYDNGWVHIRASNTEPLIRIIAEMPVRQAAEQLVQKFKSEIQEMGAPK
ncbi:MAG TPA: phosphoglucosamine mutase [bacterium]|nr:phosphoglucosamine mutase [bacterium]HNT65752.1 phosphoglucosamine mutase [bacterium]